MFERKENPGFDRLSREATELIVSWARNDWYETSFESKGAIEES
jgi:hypothetical protein